MSGLNGLDTQAQPAQNTPDSVWNAPMNLPIILLPTDGGSHTVRRMQEEEESGGGYRNKLSRPAGAPTTCLSGGAPAYTLSAALSKKLVGPSSVDEF